MAIPKRVDRRIQAGAREIQPIIEAALARDVNEADTVTIVKKILSAVMGWDPFFEVTSEYAIRGTYVDLAVKRDETVVFLIEVKSIGSDLRDVHLRQVVNYAANQGIEWVALTNGAEWQAHRVTFGKPISSELVFSVDFLHGDARSSRFRELVFVLTKEGMTKSAISKLHEEQQAMSRYNIAAILRDDDALKLVRRELRRAYPNLAPDLDRLRSILVNEVMKREVSEGEKADAADARIRKASNRRLRAAADKGSATA